MRIEACKWSAAPSVWLALWLVCAARGADAPQWMPLMYSDPALQQPPVVECYSDRLVPLWRAALRRPENETRRLAAQAIIRAKQFRLPGLEEAAPELRGALGEGSRAAQMAVARALIAIDDRQSAPQLAAAADADPLLAEVVEPALAAWDYEPRHAQWIRQLADNTLSSRRRQLAAAACGDCRLAAAATALEEVIADRGEVSTVRLTAAEALPYCAAEDPLRLAQRLAPSPFVLDELLAASALSQAKQDASADLLQRLAQHANSAVAAPAYAALAATWNDRALTLAPEVIERRSARMRLLGAEVYARQGGSEAVTALGGLLPDPAPSVRQFAQSQLAGLAADAQLRPEIETQLTAALEGSRWQGHEQGAVLAVELKHLASNQRLAQLLQAEHPVSSLAAAWALGQQAEAELMPELLLHAQELHKAHRADERRKRELMHLFQALGRNQHHPAEPLLREIMPKDTFLPAELRMAAVWAMGRIHAGQAPQEVSDLLAARFTDTEGLMPEISGVRWMAAVALATTNSQSHVETLRRFVNDPNPEVRVAVHWALTELTGQEFPPPHKHLRPIHDWFLEPTKPGRLLEAVE